MQNSDHLIIYALVIIAISIVAGYFLTQWYHRINERITQQHETNRLLRKLAGEKEIGSYFLSEARKRSAYEVSTLEEARKPLPGKTDTL